MIAICLRTLVDWPTTTTGTQRSSKERKRQKECADCGVANEARSTERGVMKRARTVVGHLLVNINEKKKKKIK